MHLAGSTRPIEAQPLPPAPAPLLVLRVLVTLPLSHLVPLPTGPLYVLFPLLEMLLFCP